MRALTRPREVVALALMLLVGVAGCLVGAAAPLSPRSPVLLDEVLAGVGVVLVAVVWAVPRRASLHLGCVVALLCTAVLVSQAATPVGSATTAYSFVWVALYAAVFFRRPVARLYTAAAGGSLGVALTLDPYRGAPQSFALTLVTLVAASELLGSHVAQLHRVGATDPLTGALNRHGLERAAARVFSAAARAQGSVAVALIDLDGFKLVNDRQGHHTGDALLRDFAAELRAELRDTDVLARSGGDEFVLVLPGADSRHVEAVARRVRRRSRVAWSFGAVTTYGDEPLPEVLRRADALLYRSKATRVVLPDQRLPAEPVGSSSTVDA